MAKKKSDEKSKHRIDPNVEGLRGDLTEQGICDTLEWNFMPYAMSIIVSRAIPEIDGFKPSHRKLLYTMYKMGLLTGSRTKSANIVGSTMRLNPHGDAAIYETMVRLSRGNGALLHPFVDSKGNFGKVYSRDMAYAAPRYTEAKLEAIAAELFRDIDFDTVDLVDNYDGTMQEPTLLPTSFPNVLVSNNSGIAAGMASNLCGFNLREVCQTTKAFIRNPDCELLETLPAPDFPTGGEILYDPVEMASIYRSGRGSFKVRARWRYVKEGNLIEIYEIPYTASIESIIDKVSELINSGKIREINDMRDETDLSGLKLTVDLKRGVDPDKLMQKLFRLTPLEDSFPCNFNILIAGMPRVLGVREILEEWVAWRTEGIRRRTFFQLQRKQERLHLLRGLARILVDIDKAIAIIRGTESDAEVIPNLMIGFGIDALQANFVAEIKLRNINQEYILKKTAESEELESAIADLEKILQSDARVKAIIVQELDEVSKKYGTDRRTGFLSDYAIAQEEDADAAPEYPVTVFVSRGGYLKKITPQSLRMSGEQKFKEGDELDFSRETSSAAELLVFSNRAQVYKTRLDAFPDTKASLLGDYLPQKLGMEEGETVAAVCFPGDYRGMMIFVFENGKVAKVELSAYATKSNRKKLTGAYCDKSPLKAAFLLTEDTQLALYSTEGKALIFSTAQLLPKSSRDTQGVSVMTLRKSALIHKAVVLEEAGIVNLSRYRAKALPAAGAILKDEDLGIQSIALM
ncbi:MAG: topoisomerase IV [Oscillospiraceae bacterium]|nr:topoisomerase IV [Oscillospiraceae bacterium]